MNEHTPENLPMAGLKTAQKQSTPRVFILSTPMICT